MRIAITSQNRKTVTEHAGRCRRFRVFECCDAEVHEYALLELEKTQTLHALAPGVPDQLAEIDVLIAAGMCERLSARLARHGIRGVLTSLSEPEHALEQFLQSHETQ